jgi:hypothetical protein
MEQGDEQYPAVFRLREDGWSTLCLMKRGYNIMQAKAAGGFMIHTAPANAVIPPLGEVGRIQVMESAFSSPDAKDINGWFIDVVNAVYENIRTIKLTDEEKA